MIRRALTVWLIIISAESLHGIVRVLFLEPQFGEFRARQIGVFTGALMILAITCIFIRWINAGGVVELFFVGLLWLILTVLFEIFFGRLLIGLTWERILSDYNLRQGGLMPIGLFLLTLSPLIAAKLRGEPHKPEVPDCL